MRLTRAASFPPTPTLRDRAQTTSHFGVVGRTPWSAADALVGPLDTIRNLTERTQGGPPDIARPRSVRVQPFASERIVAGSEETDAQQYNTHLQI